MERKYEITIYYKQQKTKPVGKKALSQIYDGFKTDMPTVEQLLYYVTSPNSFTWIPAVFNRRAKMDNWIKQSAFALDFDSGITPEEVMEKLREFDITPNIVYATFRDTIEHRRFRVVLLLEQPITDKQLAQSIINGLLKVFPDADPSCKNLSRIFHGGLTGEIPAAAPVTVNQLVDFIQINKISMDGNQTRKIAEKGVSLYYTYRNTRNSANIQSCQPPNCNYDYLTRLKKNKFDFDKCNKQVRIFRDFVEGKWLHHNQLFGIATNLIWIKGGEKLMKSTMDRYDDMGMTAYTQNNRNILPYVKKVGYLPMNLANFSPYEEDHQFSNLISSVRHPKGQIEVIYRQPKISLNVAQHSLHEHFQIIKNSNEKKVYLIIGATGIGKTKELENEERVTIALPTHALKNEVAQRMKVDYMMTPELPVFSNNMINNKINRYYSVGLNDRVYQLLKEISRNFTSKYTQMDSDAAMNYLNELNRSYKSNQSVLTTHERAIFHDFQHDTLIFDEDPLNSMLAIKNFNQSHLYGANLYMNLKGVDEALKYLQKIGSGQIKPTPNFDIDIGLLAEMTAMNSNVTTDLINFFTSDYFMTDPRKKGRIHYIKRRYPSDKKCIILSATASVPIYRQLFGDQLQVIDLGNVQNQGKVVQHVSKSFSRSSLQHSNINDLKQKVDGMPVITFKRFSDLFNDHDLQMHFGNLEGRDTLSGQDIAVLGTPHINPVAYYLFAEATGMEMSKRDTRMTDQITEWNGIRFMFMSFNDEELRKIQLSLIEAQLIQAIGRARTIRTDATVHVFSNLPLQVADEIVYD